MRTIGEYKKEFAKLLIELEKEHNVQVKKIDIEHIVVSEYGCEYEISSISCKIILQ